MGSLGSRPSVPAPQPQVIFIPAANTQSTEPSSPSTDTSVDVNTDPGSTPEQQVAESRTNNLLRRSRGRFGTVLTGFRGLLEAASSDNKRKTLLGE